MYDDSAIYFGAKMTDRAADAQLYRRDTFANFDSSPSPRPSDRLSGNAVTVTAAAGRGHGPYNDIGEDGSWDGCGNRRRRSFPRVDRRSARAVLAFGS